MRTIDDFTRPLEYLSPMDAPLRKVVREWADNEVIPHRRKFDEDYEEHKLIEPAFDKLMGEYGMQRVLFPLGPGGAGAWAAPTTSPPPPTCCARSIARGLGDGRGLRGVHWPLLLILRGAPRQPRAVLVVRPHLLLNYQVALRRQRHDRASGWRVHREHGYRPGLHHPDHGGAGRRRVGHQRPQALAHQLRRGMRPLRRGVHHQGRLQRPRRLRFIFVPPTPPA